MGRERNGSIYLEPLPEHALTAEEAREHLAQLEICVPRDVFAQKSSLTVRCFRNEVMSREYASELFQLAVNEYDVPVLRIVGPTAVAAAFLSDAASAAGRPDSLLLYTHDGARTAGSPCRDLGEYLEIVSTLIR